MRQTQGATSLLDTYIVQRQLNANKRVGSLISCFLLDLIRFTLKMRFSAYLSVAFADHFLFWLGTAFVGFCGAARRRTPPAQPAACKISSGSPNQSA